MTILGHQTISELKDLINAKDTNLAQVQKAYDEYASTWTAKDSVAASQWASEWANLKNQYAQARAKAETSFTSAALTPIADKNIPAQDSWDAVIHSLQLIPGTVSKGDLVELVGRLNDAGKQFAMPTPQPRRGEDTDLDAYNWLPKIPGIPHNPKSLMFAGLTIAAVAGVGYLFLVRKVTS